MSNNEKLKYAELYLNDFKDKHAHLWNIYFKFIYAMVCILGIHVLERNKLDIMYENPQKIILGIIEIAITFFSVIIINREYYVVRAMEKQYSDLLEELGRTRLPKINMPQNIITRSKVKTGFYICFSTFVIGIASSIIILFT